MSDLKSKAQSSAFTVSPEATPRKGGNKVKRPVESDNFFAASEMLGNGLIQDDVE